MGDSDMRPADEIKRLVQAASFRARQEGDKALWAEVLREHGCHQLADQTSDRRGLGRVIMSVWITKTGVAAVFAFGIVIGVLAEKVVPGSGTGSEVRTDSRKETSTSETPSPDILTLREMAVARDVKGLATILSEGRFGKVG